MGSMQGRNRRAFNRMVLAALMLVVSLAFLVGARSFADSGPLAPVINAIENQFQPSPTGPQGSITDGTPLAPVPNPVAPTLAQTSKNNLAACSGNECTQGKFTDPFAEPTITYTDSTGTHTATTQRKCVEDADGNLRCKPTASAQVLLPDGRILYWNNLEGTENVELNIVAEIGTVSVNDQSRVLSLTQSTNINGTFVTPSWVTPGHPDGGANPNGTPGTPLIPGSPLTTAGSTGANEGALFCSAQALLADGTVMAVGGTDWYNEPGAPGFRYGLAELEGLKSVRIFTPSALDWSQGGSMNFGRWYPTLVTLPNADVFVASGVTKLIKPIYPQAPQQSGRNVVQTETYHFSGTAAGTWTENGGTAQKSLPLFPRLHLLPNGQVFYDAGGQSFNPAGQAYDQALWNIVSVYDPTTQSWTDLGYAGLPLQFTQLGLQRVTSALNVTNPNMAADLQSTITGALNSLVGNPVNSINQLQSLVGAVAGPRAADTILGSGFRGSTFSMMLPLKQDSSGNYTKAEFLVAGGLVSAIVDPSPGTYFATALSRIDTVDTSTSPPTYSSRLTGNLNNARWFSYGVVLADGSVAIFNGANRDEVLWPGFNNAVQVTERFAPATETWQVMATSGEQRTYHNSAMLMPDGRVLVGGHAPISTGYFANFNLSALGFAPADGRDPSFEIYSPPYVFSSSRPTTTGTVGTQHPGDQFEISTDQANSITQVLLIRNTATTHDVDGDQRAVYLPFTKSILNSGHALHVTMPNAKVVPPGSYMLFLIAPDTSGNNVPSVSVPVTVTL